MYGIVLQNFQKRIQNVYKTYSFHIQISYRDNKHLRNRTRSQPVLQTHAAQ